MKKEKESTIKKRRIIFIISLLVIGSAIFLATRPANISRKEASSTTPPAETKIISAEEEKESPNLTAGKSAIPAYQDPKVKIYNQNVTKNSKIFITLGPTDNIVEKTLKIDSIRNGSFIVSTMDNDITSKIIPFSYLIIN